MDEILYQMIFKRKSFHLFRGLGAAKLTAPELEEICAFWKSLTPLCPQTRTAMRIVPAGESTNQHGQEYCIALYSEQRGNYLQNIGYLGQKLDLYLVSRNIATCWYGIGKVREETFEGLPYVIMIAIAKAEDPKKFRKDMFKAKRKSAEEIWKGQPLEGVTGIARFAPSACNSQPWRIEREGSTLKVFRYRKPGKIGILSPEGARYYNRIDMGIYLCILELCLKHQQISYDLRLAPDEGTEAELTLNAVITLTE